MTGSVNKVILIGNLGSDPESRSLSNGGEVVLFRLATNETRKTRDGQRTKHTEWHNIVIFNQALAKVAQEYMHKGSKVYIEGSLQSRVYSDSAGVDRAVVEVVLRPYGAVLTLLDSKPSEDNAQPRQQGRAPQQPRKPTKPVEDIDDEIPY